MDVSGSRVPRVEAGMAGWGAVRRRTLRGVGLGVVVALLGLAFPTARAQVQTRPLREREFVGGGAWSWFGDPRAVYHAGAHRRSYIGWDAPDGSIQVASYDHDSGQQAIVTLKARFQIDDHDTPSSLVLPVGRLMVFWSAHAGPTMFYRISSRAEDVTAWEPERTLPTNTPGRLGYTYPNPMQLSAEGNRIYLFWRGGNFNPSLSTTANLGATWSAARTVIYNPGQRPYVKYASNGRDTIAMAYTQTHPRSGRTNIYYAAYRAGALRRADGSVIATMANLPIAPTAGEKVYDWTTNGKAWVHDVALDAAEPNYSGGITLDREDPSTVYLSRQVNGIFEVQVWTTPDGGATWSSRPLTAGSVRNNYRPVSPRGQRGEDLDVVWMHGTYPSYTSFRTGLRTQLHSRDFADPSVASWVRGRLDVFARDGLTGELLQKYYWGGWSGWINFGLTPGGHPFGRPAVASWGTGRLDVFATDATTGHLLQRTFASGWRGWVDRGLGPGGHRVSSPAAVSWGFGRIDVVARDQVTGALVHWWQSGSTWTGPHRLAAGPGGAFVPSIASWASRRLDIFAVNSSGSLVQYWFDGTRWHGWANKGKGPGGLALSPAQVAADARSFQHLDVFALASAGKVLGHWWFDGAWHLQNLGTGADRIALAGLGVTSWDSSRLDVVSLDAQRHSLVEDVFAGGWAGPLHLDFPMGAAASPVGVTAAVAPVTVMADPSPRSKPIPVDDKARAAD